MVARLNLPNMNYAVESRVEVYAQAVHGLLSLEPSWEKQSKYIDFIDIYANLDHNELDVAEQRIKFAVICKSNKKIQIAMKNLAAGNSLIRLLPTGFTLI